MDTEQAMRNEEEPQRVRLVEGNLLIRTYEPKDRQQVFDLHTNGLRDTHAVLPVANPKWDDDLRNIEAVYLGEGAHFWVVEEEGRLTGMVAARRKDGETAELKRMRVAGHRRRQGLGQRLLELVEDFCRRTGYRRIVLDTTDRQAAARRLYEKNGYELISAMPIPPLTLFFYGKELWGRE
jgi:GNAT superfamily N-acetyltransferase